MKNLLLVFIGLISLPLFGQLNDTSRFTIGIYYSPEINYRTLSDSWITQLKNDDEVFKYGNSLGATLGYKINRLIQTEIGVNFSSRGYQTRDIVVISYEPDPVLPDKSKTINRFYYLGIPLKCGFRKDFTKVSLVSSIGIIPNFLLQQKVEHIFTKDEQVEHYTFDKTSEYRRFDLTTIVSLGLAYKISDKMDLRVEPTFQHGIISVMDAPLKTYLWSLGLNFGIKYKL